MDTSLFGGEDEADAERLDRALGVEAPRPGPVDRVFPRMVPAGMATEEFGWDYATTTLPGTATVYVYDLPHVYTYLNSAEVARHGADVLADVAYRNLRAVELPEPEPLDAGVWAVTDEHAGASSLILPDLMGQYTGQDEFPDGVLFSAPTNDVLLFHVPRDAGIAAALENLAHVAASAFEDDERRRVTPSAYWWDGGEDVYRVTQVDGEEITIYLSGAFEETFQRLRAGAPD